MLRGFFGNLILAIIARMLCGNHLNIFCQARCFFAYVQITKSQVPQYSAYVFVKKSSGTKVIYESNYAMRVLDSRDNGRDIKEREDRQNQKKVHVIGKRYKNCELIYPFSVCNSFFPVAKTAS